MLKKSVSRSLFGSPVSYGKKPFRKTQVLTYSSDDADHSVVSIVCIEDELSKSIPLDYRDVSLNTLVSKGVDSHALDMIDTSKIGIDAGIDALAHELTSNTSKYVETPISEPSK